MCDLVITIYVFRFVIFISLSLHMPSSKSFLIDVAVVLVSFLFMVYKYDIFHTLGTSKVLKHLGNKFFNSYSLSTSFAVIFFGPGTLPFCNVLHTPLHYSYSYRRFLHNYIWVFICDICKLWPIFSQHLFKVLIPF